MVLLHRSVIAGSTGAFLMLSDQSSATTDPLFFSRIPESKRMVTVTEYMAKREIFFFTMILDGIFRIDFNLVDRPYETEDAGSQDPNETVDFFELALPTGNLVVISATSTTAVLTLQPGLYHGILRWNLRLESEHSSLASIDAYPADEGPDGVVTMWRQAAPREAAG
jgi:hypothetical protein